MFVSQGFPSEEAFGCGVTEGKIRCRFVQLKRAKAPLAVGILNYLQLKETKRHNDQQNEIGIPGIYVSICCTVALRNQRGHATAVMFATRHVLQRLSLITMLRREENQGEPNTDPY